MKYKNTDNFNLSRPFNIFLTVIFISIIMAYIDWYPLVPDISYPRIVLASLLFLYILIGFAIGGALAVILSLIIPFLKGRMLFSKSKFFLNYFYSKLVILLILICFISSSIYIFTYAKDVNIFYFPQKQVVRGKHNVILITVDSLRKDSLGCYGYERDTTPFIDSIAKEGILFENCISQSPSSLPSYASMLTSKYPSEEQSFRNAPEMLPTGRLSNNKVNLPESALTIADIFSNNGYLTTGFAGSDFLKSSFNLNQGFDYYNDNIPPFALHFFNKLGFINFFIKIGLIKKDNAIKIMNSVLMPLSNRIHGESFVNPREINVKSGKRANEINSVVFKWLNNYSVFSFFMFINYFDPHAPYDAPVEFADFFTNEEKEKIERYDDDGNDIGHLRNLYDEEIRFTDSEIEKLFRKIETLGLKEKTLLIITSNHGVAFGEHGFTGDGRTLYNEIIDIPLIIYAPWISETPIRIKNNVELIDLLPTILELTSIKDDNDFSGVSLMPLIKGDTASFANDYSLSQFFNNNSLKSIDYRYGISCSTVKKDNLKFIDNSSTDDEFYDLENDPRELNNIMKDKIELVALYKDILKKIPSADKY